MRMKKTAALLLALALALGGFSACGKNAFENVEFGYGDGTKPNADGSLMLTEYDTSLFYRNDLSLKKVADPCALYIEEGDYAGTIFVYGTSNTLGAAAFGVWGSTDGVNWTSYGVAFEPDRKSWSYSSLWAPEVIRSETDGRYYMTYSGRNANCKAAGGRYYDNTYIGLAVSDSPVGPFVQWTGTNGNGDLIGLGDPILDPAKISAVDGVACETGKYERYRFLDSSYFVDKDGSIYLYVSKGQDRYNVLTEEDEIPQSERDKSDIWVFACEDFATIDYSSAKILTAVGYNTPDDRSEANINDVDAERAAAETINEAPQMYERDGMYYLTYSVGGTTSNLYAVAQAIGKSPEGPFRKLSKAEGGLVLAADMNWIQNAGTGHHFLTEIGDELFIFHHEGADRYMIDSNNRAVAYDRVGFINNGKEVVMAANGPTSYSLQALPQVFSGYKNIAPEAEVTAEGLAQGGDTKWLTDGFFASHTYGAIGETEFAAGAAAKVELKWDGYRKIRSLMIYNSIDYGKTFYKIARIEFSVRMPSGAKGTVAVDDAAFRFDETTCYGAMELMFAGSNLVLDFNEIEVNAVTVTFKAPRSEGVAAIGDIWVLGK